MKTIEVQAKTIDQAIGEALETLGVGYDEVEVEVISNGGMFKKAKIRVTVKATTEHKAIAESKIEVKAEKQEKISSDFFKEEKAEEKKETAQEFKKQEAKKTISATSNEELCSKFTKCIDFIKKLLTLLENNSEITFENNDKSFNISINGDHAGILIGKKGEVLNALQTLVSSVAIANAQGEGKRVYINIEDYKERRKETLIALAQKKASVVKESGRYIKFEPMNSRDRAIIHSTLQSIEGIRTYSTGKDPYRCLCIAPAEKDADK